MTEEANLEPATDPLMKTLGFVRMLESDQGEDRVCVEFEAKRAQCHSGNIVQGGFVTGWIDSAMAHAVMIRTKYELVPLSLELKVAFYRAAHPGLVVAEGWVELLGKRTAFVEGLLRTPEGEVIAKGTSTVTLKPIRR